jgi:four helix bundle protein
MRFVGAQFLLVALKIIRVPPVRAQHADCTRRIMRNHESFRDLQVWQRSMTLVEQIYNVTSSFPHYERFGLTSQLRRASVSIPSNIGEGKRRKRQRVFVNHLEIALGSQAEVEVQLEIAKRVGFLTTQDYERIQVTVEEVGRMLNGLIASMLPEQPRSYG